MNVHYSNLQDNKDESDSNTPKEDNKFDKEKKGIIIPKFFLIFTQNRCLC